LPNLESSVPFKGNFDSFKFLQNSQQQGVQDILTMGQLAARHRGKAQQNEKLKESQWTKVEGQLKVNTKKSAMRKLVSGKNIDLYGSLKQVLARGVVSAHRKSSAGN
jgi:hypothetical protein